MEKTNNLRLHTSSYQIRYRQDQANLQLATCYRQRYVMELNTGKFFYRIRDNPCCKLSKTPDIIFAALKRTNSRLETAVSAKCTNLDSHATTKLGVREGLHNLQSAQDSPTARISHQPPIAE
jgi:hypothetical protein